MAIVPDEPTANDPSNTDGPVLADRIETRRMPWVPLVAVAFYWVAFVVLGLQELPMFNLFLARMGAIGLLTLIFLGWWLVRGPLRVSLRFLVIGFALVIGVAFTFLMDRTVLAFSVHALAIPALLTGWVLWLVASRSVSDRARLQGMLLIPVLVWLPGLMVRMEGLTGTGQADFHWRWKKSAEEDFLVARNESPKSAAASSDVTLSVTADDWPDFRGVNRDAVVRNATFDAKWDQNPPTLIWKTRVGPGWSSVAVVGDRIFTQEQRGDVEVVSCFDANDGAEVWLHRDPGRFEEKLGGVGPRATPVFSGGRIYSLGAAGRLNCLEAATGRSVWSRDILADTEATVPIWGFSGTPLVTADRVIVFAGGQAKKALIAYQRETGDISWTSPAGADSYSSPQLVTIAGKPQVLFVGNEYLSAFEPDTGKLLWQFKSSESFGRPVLQPRLIATSQLLLSFSPNEGVSHIEVTNEGDQWNALEKWNSREIKPDFSDLVTHDGYLYGFDGSIFCCVDLKTGKRQWKGGRYGAGQVILFADQPILLVITEQGELVLVECNPAKHAEIARSPAIKGKTWNHLSYSNGRLFVRNSEEMARFDLDPAQ